MKALHARIGDEPKFEVGNILPRPYTPLVWGIPESEKRRRRAETLYELEALFREDDWLSSSECFFYDAEHDLYRFPDGEFAFSKEYANEGRLREEGFVG